jgi:hypothetical protein
MQPIGSSETLVPIYQTIRRLKPKDGNLHSHRHETAKISYLISQFEYYFAFKIFATIYCGTDKKGKNIPGEERVFVLLCCI